MGFWARVFGGDKRESTAARPAQAAVGVRVAIDPPGRKPIPPTGERVPAKPVGRAVSPWASESLYTNLVGESHYKAAFRALFKERGISLSEDGRELTDVAAHLAIDPGNPFDSTAVAVWISGHHVGYLPRDTAAEYFPALEELADEH